MDRKHYSKEFLHIKMFVFHGAELRFILNSFPRINPYSIGQFSVSGREGSAVAPKGRVHYLNPNVNLKVIFEWNSTGWTSWKSSAANVVITGIPEDKKGFFKSTPKPWNQVLVGEFDPETWTFQIRPVEGTMAETQRAARNLSNHKVQI